MLSGNLEGPPDAGLFDVRVLEGFPGLSLPQSKVDTRRKGRVSLNWDIGWAVLLPALSCKLNRLQVDNWRPQKKARDGEETANFERCARTRSDGGVRQDTARMSADASEMGQPPRERVRR